MAVDFNNRTTLKLSIQHALLGNVTSNLAGFQGKLENNHIKIAAYFFESPSEKDKGYIDDLETFIIADFPPPFTIETHCRLLKEATFTTLLEWDFLRAEALSSLKS